MEAYTNFAAVYDMFMDNVPYQEWSTFLQELLIEYGIDSGLVLELACGTGTMTELLAGYGYDMIGVDNSEDMLEIAQAKRQEFGLDILYLLQDMREFELYGTVRAIVSVCDSMNYMTDPKDLQQVFYWVNNYLDPGGVFIFDFNTDYKYQELLGQRTIAENREDCSFIWDNYYYEAERINEYELSLFLKDSQLSKDGQEIYRKFQEIHYQRAYSLTEIKAMLAASGLEFVTAYDGFSKRPAEDISERILVIAREQIKGTDKENSRRRKEEMK